MADPNDDEWLYGANDEVEAPDAEEEKLQEEVDEVVPAKNGVVEMSFDEHNFEEAGDHEHLIADESKDGNEESNDQGSREENSDSDDDDDDDDDINVVIGDILPKGAGASGRFTQDGKSKQPGSKFNIEEFESVGTINGQPSIEFAIESIEDKPWRKPGADITDYFNYGFNEETWRAYCERQKRMRIHESGVGLASLTAAQNPQGMQMDIGPPQMGPRHGINIGFKRMPHPRPPKPAGTIDVIGAPSQNPIRAPAPRENIIQVMTADRREYSRTVVNQSQMPMQFNVPPEEFYNHEEQDAFNYGYEPTQDSQWNPNQGSNPNWAPSEIKELTPMNQPPPNMSGRMNLNIPPPLMGSNSGPRMPMMNPQMIPPLMGQHMSMNIKQEDDKREMRGGRSAGGSYSRDIRGGDDRKRRERSSSRERTRDKYRSERTTRESSSRLERRKSKSRERKRSRSRDKSDKTKRSKSRDKERSSRRGTEDKSAAR